MGRITLDDSREGLGQFPTEFRVVGRDDLGDVLAVDAKGKVWRFAHGTGDWSLRSPAFNTVALMHEHTAFQEHFEPPAHDADLATLRERKKAIAQFMRRRRGSPYTRDSANAALHEVRHMIEAHRSRGSQRGTTARPQERPTLAQNDRHRLEGRLRKNLVTKLGELIGTVVATSALGAASLFLTPVSGLSILSACMMLASLALFYTAFFRWHHNAIAGWHVAMILLLLFANAAAPLTSSAGHYYCAPIPGVGIASATSPMPEVRLVTFRDPVRACIINTHGTRLPGIALRNATIIGKQYLELPLRRAARDRTQLKDDTGAQATSVAVPIVASNYVCAMNGQRDLLDQACTEWGQAPQQEGTLLWMSKSIAMALERKYTASLNLEEARVDDRNQKQYTTSTPQGTTLNFEFYSTPSRERRVRVWDTGQVYSALGIGIGKLLVFEVSQGAPVVAGWNHVHVELGKEQSTSEYAACLDAALDRICLGHVQRGLEMLARCSEIAPSALERARVNVVMARASARILSSSSSNVQSGVYLSRAIASLHSAEHKNHPVLVDWCMQHIALHDATPTVDDMQQWELMKQDVKLSSELLVRARQLENSVRQLRDHCREQDDSTQAWQDMCDAYLPLSRPHEARGPSRRSHREFGGMRLSEIAGSDELRRISATMDSYVALSVLGDIAMRAMHVSDEEVDDRDRILGHLRQAMGHMSWCVDVVATHVSHASDWISSGFEVRITSKTGSQVATIAREGSDSIRARRRQAELIAQRMSVRGWSRTHLEQWQQILKQMAEWSLPTTGQLVEAALSVDCGPSIWAYESQCATAVLGIVVSQLSRHEGSGDARFRVATHIRTMLLKDSDTCPAAWWLLVAILLEREQGAEFAEALRQLERAGPRQWPALLYDTLGY